MSVTDIIRKANAAGVSMAADGDILRLFAPKKPPDDLLAELRDHKAENLAHLIQPGASRGFAARADCRAEAQ